MVMEDSDGNSLNPWGISFGLRRGSSSGSSANTRSNDTAANGSHPAAGSMGSISRATAKKHPLSVSPRSSNTPASPPLDEGSEHELTRENSVVVHPTSPTDTFSSIALRYGADVNTILRANRLWPGDAPQMRAEIFIPLLNCKRTPPDTILRAKAAIFSSASTSGSRSPSASGAGKSVLSSREGPGAEGLPSATASTATSGGMIVPLAPGFNKPTTHSHKAASSTGGSSSAGHGERSSREGERDWKPNKYTFGSGSTSSASRSKPSMSGAGSASDLASNTARGSGIAGKRRESPGAAAGGSKDGEVERASSGWNDAPAAGARIARAYQDGTRKIAHHRLIQDLAAGLPPNSGAAANWQRPINDSLPIPQASLPGGSGRAGGNSTRPDNGASRSQGGYGNAGASIRAAQPGLGKILSDAFRGRMSVEDAFEAAVQSVSSSVTTPPTESTSSWATVRASESRTIGAGPRALSPQPGYSPSEGLRPRLSGRGASGSEYETVSPFGSMRGASGNGFVPGQPSPPGHELERLSFEESAARAEKWDNEQERLNGQGKSGGGAAGSRTLGSRLHPSTAGASSGLGRNLGGTQVAGASGGSGLRARGSVRNFDWSGPGNGQEQGS
ncbi:hypothetical protein A4X13_0g241 [Tilletia indica]|uniref:Uncharacterized protein n=1 Tax=Tilletia indica TaxID=43049 RepID=A0A177TW86_9BASI|nr:hypothetical protein A4X13_0g241 [Tilletia indica]